MLIVDGTLVPTRDDAVAEQSKNNRYSTNHQVVIDADTDSSSPSAGRSRATAMIARHGNFPVRKAVGRTTVIADGGYRGTDLLITHRRERGQTELPAWKEEHNSSHRQIRPASSTSSRG
ncbi:transposase [Streptomyces griseorubiginosus]|uniref:transposase n=1 Tax=Streptomyces griseorubiginosus TaxID=67304 RepID=UPI0036ED9A74